MSAAIARSLTALVAFAVIVIVFTWGWRARGGRVAMRGVTMAISRWISELGVMRASRTRYPRAWAFLQRRVSAASAFGLHLTLGLAISVLALGAFAKVADDVLERDDLARVDAMVSGVVAAHRTAPQMQLCRVASDDGAPATIVVLGAAVACLLVLRRRRRLAGAWVAILAGGGLLNRILKAAFHRERPAGAMAYLHNDSWSFPSGHSMGATVFYGMLAFLLVRWARARGWRTPAQAGIVASAALVVLLIGASRVCLGVHYTTDVVAGFSAGVMWLAACIAGVGTYWRQDTPHVTDTRTFRTPPPAPRDPAA